MTSPDYGEWRPPSGALQKRDGLWQPHKVSVVSYPEEGNDVCFQVEDDSYWFAHRNERIMALVNRFPFSGTFYDIGGRNGFVALGLQNAGLEVALIEPGKGARNAAKRGVRNVVQAALGDAALQPHSLDAAGAFDVVEHIMDDVTFLTSIRHLLRPGGRFYCTVPAMNALWSDEDIHAGHYRRYSKRSLAEAIRKAGFEVEFLSSCFAWLSIPVFVLRALPYRIRGSRAALRGKIDAVQADHRLPVAITGIVRMLHAWELVRLRRAGSIRFGTSLLCVARAPLP